MALALDDLVNRYLADKDFQDEQTQIAIKRSESIGALQAITKSFIYQEIDLQTFGKQLDKVLATIDNWGARGPAFMMALNRLGKNHNDSNDTATIHLQLMLKNLNSANLGQRIEQMHNFLLQEKERLRRAGNAANTIVPASRSPFIISLFACWLDPEYPSIIYYDSLRKGLFTLIKMNVVPQPPDLSLDADSIVIKSEKDHQACLESLEYIKRTSPQIATHDRWIETFALWINKNSFSLSSNTLIKETDSSAILATSPNTSLTADEIEHTQTTTAIIDPTDKTSLLIQNGPLMPTPEPLLTQLIQEVQRHIFIDTPTIKRIYHALLAGHVILTGPPGTGKTELARIIPEMLWQSQATPQTSTDVLDDDYTTELTTETAYTTRLVTATDDWSPRTLISGIAPQSQNGLINYKIQYGHLTTAILKNWSFQGENAAEWSHITLQRTRIKASGTLDRSSIQTFKGQWLVIDEFNRAPIDLALGDALTALGGHDALRVGIEGGSAELPIPQDFRIIGTLNSFDRHYLNQISEALKRRFSFIELLPPTRAQRVGEQNIVLYKALQKISHLSPAINNDEQTEHALYWENYLAISVESTGGYMLEWLDGSTAFQLAFDAAWDIFEVVRIYRQLGTAQAINLFQHMLIEGILQNYTTPEQWIEQALDTALCDTIADQLQLLLPDEIEILLLALISERTTFSIAYSKLLGNLANSPQRFYSQLLALSTILDETGQPLLSTRHIEKLADLERPELAPELLTRIFHLKSPAYRLTQFTRRLQEFKSERGM